jgi:DNA-binding transcriptional LysR family regulator
MDLGLRRLRILREVASRGGVTAAAEALHYSPSGVSQQLAALEKEVGAPLFERLGRGLRITDVGRVLLEHADVLLTAERAAQAAVEDVRGTMSAPLTVGVFATVAAGLVPHLVADLRFSTPDLRLRTREVDPEDALPELHLGHLDLAFLIDYPDATEPWPTSVTLHRIGTDSLRLAAPPGLLPRRRTVPLASLSDTPWVLSGSHTYYGRAVRAACRRAGFEVEVTHEVDEQATALAMVRAGLGVTLVSELALDDTTTPGVDVHRLVEPVRRQILVAHDVATTARPAVRAFVRSARRAARAAGLQPPSG